MINRGHDGDSPNRGAFLSIVITISVSATLWVALGLHQGFSTMNRTAVAWFVLAGMLTVLIGRVFLYASIQSLGAIQGTTIKRLNPFFSVLLGVLVLDEALSGEMVIGMLLIFSSFAVLLLRPLIRARNNGLAEERDSAFGKLASLGYIYGPVSALAYATGYVARKKGLLAMSDPLFGTMVGALAGALIFIAVSPFIDRYRNDLKAAFSDFNPWLLAAGMFGTLGQICYFAALKYSGISKIALIASMEIFVTMLLSYLIIRRKQELTPEVIVAAILGTIGTLFVICY